MLSKKEIAIEQEIAIICITSVAMHYQYTLINIHQCSNALPANPILFVKYRLWHVFVDYKHWAGSAFAD
jgi:hypothetical protein